MRFSSFDFAVVLLVSHVDTALVNYHASTRPILLEMVMHPRHPVCRGEDLALPKITLE